MDNASDLHPIYFLLWGHVKNMVYQGQEEQTEEELWERIQNSFAGIWAMPGLFKRVHQSPI
jgi:hypothetical protein